MPEPAYASEVDWRRRHAAAHEHRLRAIQAGDLETEDYWTQRLIYIQSGLPGARIPVREAFLDELFTFGAEQAAIRDDEEPARIRNIRDADDQARVRPRVPGLTKDEIARITELAAAPYVYGLEGPPTRDEARRALRERRVYEDIRPAVQVLSIIAAPDETRLAVINLELARLDALISERQDIIDRRTEHDIGANTNLPADFAAAMSRLQADPSNHLVRMAASHPVPVDLGPALCGRSKFSYDRNRPWSADFHCSKAPGHEGPCTPIKGLESAWADHYRRGYTPSVAHTSTLIPVMRHGCPVVYDDSIPVGVIDFVEPNGRRYRWKVES